jgi:GNAT superfamily N-acetyltransferase
MFDVNVSFGDVCITSIEKEDIKSIEQWLNSQKCHMDHDGLFPINYDELYQRFLEYYVNECEFFLKINKDGKFSGIIKGRIEFKNPNEVWIGCFFLDNDIRKKGIGSEIIDNITLYFNKVYGIRDFSTGVARNSEGTLKFWKNNGYKILRVAQDFYNHNDGYEDMCILKKNL